MKLVLSVGKIAGGTIDPEMMINPSEQYFDDSLFFEVEEDEDEHHDEKSDDRRQSMTQLKYVYPVLKGTEGVQPMGPRSYSNHGIEVKE